MLRVLGGTTERRFGYALQPEGRDWSIETREGVHTGRRNIMSWRPLMRAQFLHA